MKWILIVLGVLLVLVAIIVLVGLMLPREHRATSVVTIRQPPEAVWAVVRDLAQVPAYWADIKTSHRVADRSGHETWSQTMKDGTALSIEVVESEPPRRLVTLISPEPGTPFGGSWIYEISAAPDGCQVRVTEDGWVANPIFRFVSRVMGYHASLDSYLKALALKFGETAHPTHVLES